MRTNSVRSLMMVIFTLAIAIVLAAQAPQGAGGAPGAGGQGRGGQRGPSLTVTTTAWPDGGEVPQKHAGRGGNMSPAFDFSWVQGANPGTAPANLASYAIIFHDLENPPRGTDPAHFDTLHWLIWDIPGTATGIKEGLPMGDLPDGSKQTTTNVGRGGYFGPGAGVGPFHHYLFEFYALDTKLNLPNTATRAEVFKAMEGHVVGKAAFFGRFHATQ